LTSADDSARRLKGLRWRKLWRAICAPWVRDPTPLSSSARTTSSRGGTPERSARLLRGAIAASRTPP
jgi:hypothetical protein